MEPALAQVLRISLVAQCLQAEDCMHSLEGSDYDDTTMAEKNVTKKT